jgi:RNA-binding protein 25
VLRAQDNFINQLLQECGRVRKWDRASAENKPKNFGFCTFAEPEAALRAVKLLNGFKVDYQEISVKLSKKDQEKLDKLEKPVEEDAERDEVSA